MSSCNAELKARLSVGMPVYNGAKFIREALDSLLAQTFTDFELIISDNASTDETETICREYAAKDKRIRYIRQPENRGAVANFQFVLDEASGEYFMWAAADDVWDKNWIATLFPICTADKCIAFGTVQTIDGDGNPMRHPANRRNFSYSGLRLMRRLKYYFEPAFLGKANPIYGIYPKVLLSSDIVNSLSSVESGADTIFMYALLAQAEIKGNRKTVLYKRIHEDCAGGVMQTNNQKRSIAYKILMFLRQSVTAQCQNLKHYGSLSTAFERAIHIVFFPFALTFSIIMRVMHKLQFLAK